MMLSGVFIFENTPKKNIEMNLILLVVLVLGSKAKVFNFLM